MFFEMRGKCLRSQSQVSAAVSNESPQVVQFRLSLTAVKTDVG